MSPAMPLKQLKQHPCGTPLPLSLNVETTNQQPLYPTLNYGQGRDERSRAFTSPPMTSQQAGLDRKLFGMTGRESCHSGWRAGSWAEPRATVNLRRLARANRGPASRRARAVRTAVVRYSRGVVQEAFLKLASQRPPEKPAAWLFRVVRNGPRAALAARRRRRHETEAATGPASGSKGIRRGKVRAARADGCGRAAVVASGTARGDRRSSLGWSPFQEIAELSGLLGEHGTRLYSRVWPSSRTVGGLMSQIRPILN